MLLVEVTCFWRYSRIQDNLRWKGSRGLPTTIYNDLNLPFSIFRLYTSSITDTQSFSSSGFFWKEWFLLGPCFPASSGRIHGTVGVFHTINELLFLVGTWTLGYLKYLSYVTFLVYISGCAFMFRLHLLELVQYFWRIVHLEHSHWAQ